MSFDDLICSWLEKATALPTELRVSLAERGKACAEDYEGSRLPPELKTHKISASSAAKAKPGPYVAPTAAKSGPVTRKPVVPPAKKAPVVVRRTPIAAAAVAVPVPAQAPESPSASSNDTDAAAPKDEQLQPVLNTPEAEGAAAAAADEQPLSPAREEGVAAEHAESPSKAVTGAEQQQESPASEGRGSTGGDAAVVTPSKDDAEAVTPGESPSKRSPDASPQAPPKKTDPLSIVQAAIARYAKMIDGTPEASPACEDDAAAAAEPAPAAPAEDSAAPSGEAAREEASPPMAADTRGPSPKVADTAPADDSAAADGSAEPTGTAAQETEAAPVSDSTIERGADPVDAAPADTTSSAPADTEAQQQQ